MYIIYLKIFLLQFEFSQTIARKFVNLYKNSSSRSKYRKHFIQSSLKYQKLSEEKKNSL